MREALEKVSKKQLGLQEHSGFAPRGSFYWYTKATIVTPASHTLYILHKRRFSMCGCQSLARMECLVTVAMLRLDNYSGEERAEFLKKHYFVLLFLKLRVHFTGSEGGCKRGH